MNIHNIIYHDESDIFVCSAWDRPPLGPDKLYSLLGELKNSLLSVEIQLALTGKALGASLDKLHRCDTGDGMTCVSL